MRQQQLASNEAADPGSDAHGPQPLSGAARRMAEVLYRSRRSRERFLGSELFAEPAWDMLLDLTIWHCRRQLSVSAVFSGSTVAPATAARYLDLLIDRGLVERVQDPNDRRRTHVRLSRAGEIGMESVLLSLRASADP